MKLKVKIETKGVETEVTLDSRSQCLIGRTGADIKLDDSKCSRAHCLIFVGEDHRLHIRDLESSNGTFVNGKQVTEGPLEVKDEIRAGNSRLWVLEFTPAPDSEKTDGAGAATQQQSKELLSQWPDMLRSLPKKDVETFIDQIDEEQKKKSVRLQDIIKKRKQG